MIKVSKYLSPFDLVVCNHWTSQNMNEFWTVFQIVLDYKNSQKETLKYHGILKPLIFPNM